MSNNKKKNKTLLTAARKLITTANSKAIVSEQFKTLRTNINFSMPDREIKTMLFTSASPSEGKSTVAANSAVVFAQEGKRVLLIDGDMRKPTVHYTFHLTNTSGLSNLLTGQAHLEGVIKHHEIENLDIVTCGPIPPNPAELLGSNRMEKIIGDLKEKYDMIIFDAPPVLSVTDAQILSNLCDGTVIVLSAGKTQKDALLKAKEALIASKANILGVVLNNYVLQKDHYYYQYYGVEE